MRVAVASWTSRYVGGVESYLGTVMPAMRNRGTDVAFFHEVDEPAARAPIETGPGVPVFSVAASGIERAIAELVSWKPDVVFNHGLHDVLTADRLREVAPSVMFVHTYIGTCISGTKTHQIPYPVACTRRFGPACLALYFPRRCGGSNPITMARLYRTQRLRQELLRHQLAVITHSEHMKQELANHGVPARVLPFPTSMADADDVAPVETSSDILFAGRMDRVKGGLLLLDALPQICRAIDGRLRAQFCGDGPDRPQWERRARLIERDEPQISIEFSGWAGEFQLSAFMRKSRLLVVPSVWPEPFGSVGMTAARYGVPAAAFAVGGIPQWLHDGVNGHLAPATPPTAAGLADAVVRCLRDPNHYADLSRGALQMAEQFTLERHLVALTQVLQDVIDGRRT